MSYLRRNPKNLLKTGKLMRWKFLTSNKESVSSLNKLSQEIRIAVLKENLLLKCSLKALTYDERL